jgi:hypothetical protein
MTNVQRLGLFSCTPSETATGTGHYSLMARVPGFSEYKMSDMFESYFMPARSRKGEHDAET